MLTNFDALSIAASLPGSRDDTLDALERALEQHPYRDEASVERQRELARLRRGECAMLDFLAPSGRYDEELQLARRCGARHHIFTNELAMGNFAAAWADRPPPPSLDWPYGEGMIAIALGKWKEASQVVERLAKKHAAEANYPERRASALEWVHHDHCMAKWFDVLAGDPKAADALRTLAADRAYHPLVCAPIAAQVLVGEERTRYLSDALAAPDPGHHTDEELLAQALLWNEGVDVRYVDAGMVWEGIAGTEVITPTVWLLGLSGEARRGGARLGPSDCAGGRCIARYPTR